MVRSFWDDLVELDRPSTDLFRTYALPSWRSWFTFKLDRPYSAPGRPSIRRSAEGR